MFKNNYVINVFNEFKNKNKNKKEYLQAVEEILSSIEILFDNNEDLALKMEQIINSDPKDYTNHIKKTQTLAVEKFSTERYGEEMYRIYAKILNKE